MKNKQAQNPVANAPMQGNRSQPANKDNLDSRKNEEQLFKGDDVTHNEKKTKEDHLKKGTNN